MTEPPAGRFPFAETATLTPPAAADRDAGARAWERWPGPAVADGTAARAWLDAIFGNSPFLTGLALRENETTCAVLGAGPDAVMADLPALAPIGAGEAETARHLRAAKRRLALVAGLADLAGLWPLDRVTRTLAEFAGAALTAALGHLLDAAAARGAFRPADRGDPAHDSGIVVLGMGKLGAFELNYSSDIDLIILFETERLRHLGVADPQSFMTKLTRALARLLEERTADGYVFRVDLRLRPDPGSTPPAISVEAAETYYASVGQNWERAALIKARPVAGDLAAGERFLRGLRSFLWRKHLDFAAIRDIHSIKRQVDARQAATPSLMGFNVKLGRGGIREIEFFVQTQQLIWGGRRPALRTRGTVETLWRLVGDGRVEGDAAAALTRCYRHLREIEHRLQMIDDAQTHSLPEDPAAFARFAVFMGHDDAADFARALTATLDTVRAAFDGLFPDAPSLAGPGDLVFTGTETEPATRATIERLGFKAAERVAETVRGWHHGRIRATRSQRARELLTELVPRFLAKLGETPDPDAAFGRFDAFLGQLPAGVQLFSLFEHRPGVFDLVARIMGEAPLLADQLARRPVLLDGALDAAPTARLDRDGALADIRATLARAADYEETLDLARRWVGDWRFQVALAVLRGALDGSGAGRDFSRIAEAAITALLPSVEAEFARTHGAIAGGGFVVLALGKLGGGEMNLLSDIDLVFVYDAPDAAAQSDGKRPLGVSTYYARLGQRLINALSAPTAEGALYDVDMRLRPSGAAGPLATSLDAFRRYHAEQAWTWERMALTRARVVAGTPALADAVDGVVLATLTRPRDWASQHADIVAMRHRILDAHPGETRPWDCKHRRGALVDLEFLVQALLLRHAPERPDILSPNTLEALGRLEAHGLIAAADAGIARAALEFWHRLQQHLRVTLGKVERAAAPSDLIARALARATGLVDDAAQRRAMDGIAASALALYDRLIETSR